MRLDPVLDPVDTGHELRGECEVRVAGGIRSAELDPLRFRVGSRDRDTDRRRAIARRVDEVHRSLEAGDQAAVRVERGVGEGEHRGGVFQQPTDVPPSDVGESAVPALVVEERRAVAPERLVGVHARSVITEERFRHERRRFAPLLCRVLDDVLELEDVVGRVHHRVEAVVDLGLTARADLVVGALENEARIDQLEADVVAKVGLLVDRAHRKVPALERCLVREVSTLFDAAGIPCALFGVDEVEARVLLGLVAHVVEDVELGFGGEIRRVGDACRREVLLGLFGDLAGVAVVDLTVARIVNVENHDEGALGAERVDVARRDVGDELHVGFMDRRETADGRSVEQLADREELFVDGGGRDVEMLLHTGQIGEADVEEFDVGVLDELQDLRRISEHSGDSYMCSREGTGT